MDESLKEKWRTLNPEKSFVITVEYNEQEIADEMYRVLELMIPYGYSDLRIDGKTITVKCNCWSGVAALESMARVAKMNIYEKKFNI